MIDLHGGTCTCPVCQPDLWAVGIKGNPAPYQPATITITGGTATPPLTEADVRRIVRDELVRCHVVVDRSDDI